MNGIYSVLNNKIIAVELRNLQKLASKKILVEINQRGFDATDGFEPS